MPSAARARAAARLPLVNGSSSHSSGATKQLVGLAAGVRAEEDDAVALLDDPDAVLALLGEHLADDAAVGFGLDGPFLGDERRFLLEPDELGVAVGEASPRAGALVDEGVHVVETGLAGCRRTGLPGLGDEPELAAREIGERAHVAGRMDDYLLAPHRGAAGEEPLGTVADPRPWPEGGKLVRDDAHAPAGRVRRPAWRPDEVRLGWSRRLPALVEGAAGRVVVLRPFACARRPGPPGPGRRNDDPAPREWVAAELRRRVALGQPVSPVPLPRKGASRSIGSGRISVDERSELISSIVCR